MLLDRDAILDAPDKKIIEVDVPEWGEGAKVRLGTMGALDVAKINDWLGSKIKKQTDDNSEKKTDAIITCDSPAPEGEILDEPDRPEQNIEMKMSLTEDAEFMIRYLSYSILDPKTNLLCFTVEDIEKLGAKDKKPLRRLFNAALELNIETKQAIEDAEKNSGATAKGDSGGD